ncbi:hypothetical protein BZG02_14870 [Labilibaculum filiforme]|uniref:Outer membrane protein beta-barrel domain-containing protein n=2 Tax=Labilibaculum filiforme TaxID=1940526 RepID=A0A2N3HUG4_9BACT|nr:hypothetical protein BZG02_14870 [Labilibaculum filiforme]
MQQKKIKKYLPAILFLLLFASSIKAQEQNKFKQKTDFQFTAGLNRGINMGASLVLHELSTEFPFDIRFGVGYTWLNPGSSADARRIFINNATNGVPEEKGHSIDARIDFLKPMTLMGNTSSYWFIGPRYSKFRGNFKYVGGNEDFDVTSPQFGFGGGFESHYKISDGLKLIIIGGLDYYLPAKLQGHDTSYYPDNDNVNARTNNETDTNFRYKDADKAVDQPKFMPRFLVGIQLDL